MAQFIQGLELSRLYYLEAVKPILDAHFPDLRYDAALIGSGSEVLGFDTARSTDHHWGCRVMLFLSEADHTRCAPEMDAALRRELPHRFRGYPTSMTPDAGEPWVLHFDESRTAGEVAHFNTIRTVGDFVQEALEWDGVTPLEVTDWLTFPQQNLRVLTAGGVWYSGLGAVERVRQQLAYFPHDVWLYLLAAGWARIGQEEAFVGRGGEVGDELGSRVITARLIRDLMFLCFLMEKVYAPYPKWYGTGFARLTCASTLTPIFHRALSAQHWQQREAHLCHAYETIAKLHNALGLTDPLPTDVTRYHGRPFNVIHGDRFADALIKVITDPEVKHIAQQPLIGSIDQFSDNTDFRANLRKREALKALYR